MHFLGTTGLYLNLMQVVTQNQLESFEQGTTGLLSFGKVSSRQLLLQKHVHDDFSHDVGPGRMYNQWSSQPSQESIPRCGHNLAAIGF